MAWGGVKVPGTFIEFAKDIIDEINAPLSDGAVKSTCNTAHVGGIHFYDSMVVFEKRQRPFAPFELKIGK